MFRIFTTLSIVALLMMLSTLLLGLCLGDLRVEPSAATKYWATVHRLAGVATALAVVLVDSIVVTYFIGTSRWCREVVEAYNLDPALLRRSTSLKRRTFPWALGGMLLVVGVIALGGAADPATARAGTEAWVVPHLIGAIVGAAAIGWSFLVQGTNLYAHHQLIQTILSEVKRIRAAQGLEV